MLWPVDTAVPTPVASQAVKRAVARAVSARPPALLIIWELPDGTIDWEAFPDSPSMLEGLAKRFYGLVRTDDI